MANDAVVSDPFNWPNANLGDDIAGSETLHFFAKKSDGTYVDVAPKLGLAVPIPTRGIATGDADGDGKLDFAVARQYGDPIFYHNEAPGDGGYIDLKLTHEQMNMDSMGMGSESKGNESMGMENESMGTAPMSGSPVIDAQVMVTTADGKCYISRVDGGSGHGGKRSSEVHIGLGNAKGAVKVQLKWRDREGAVHQQTLQLSQGHHWLELGKSAKEK
jgi:hypothetical protein